MHTAGRWLDGDIDNKLPGLYQASDAPFAAFPEDTADYRLSRDERLYKLLLNEFPAAAAVGTYLDERWEEADGAAECVLLHAGPNCHAYLRGIVGESREPLALVASIGTHLRMLANDAYAAEASDLWKVPVWYSPSPARARLGERLRHRVASAASAARDPRYSLPPGLARYLGRGVDIVDLFLSAARLSYVTDAVDLVETAAWSRQGTPLDARLLILEAAAQRRAKGPQAPGVQNIADARYRSLSSLTSEQRLAALGELEDLLAGVLSEQGGRDRLRRRLTYGVAGVATLTGAVTGAAAIAGKPLDTATVLTLLGTGLTAVGLAGTLPIPRHAATDMADVDAWVHMHKPTVARLRSVWAALGVPAHDLEPAG